MTKTREQFYDIDPPDNLTEEDIPHLWRETMYLRQVLNGTRTANLFLAARNWARFALNKWRVNRRNKALQRCYSSYARKHLAVVKHRYLEDKVKFARDCVEKVETRCLVCGALFKEGEGFVEPHKSPCANDRYGTAFTVSTYKTGGSEE